MCAWRHSATVSDSRASGGFCGRIAGSGRRLAVPRRPPGGTVKLTKSSSSDPQDTGLEPAVNPPCWGSETAVSLNLTIPNSRAVSGRRKWPDLRCPQMAGFDPSTEGRAERLRRRRRVRGGRHDHRHQSVAARLRARRRPGTRHHAHVEHREHRGYRRVRRPRSLLGAHPGRLVTRAHLAQLSIPLDGSDGRGRCRRQKKRAGGNPPPRGFADADFSPRV